MRGLPSGAGLEEASGPSFGILGTELESDAWVDRVLENVRVATRRGARNSRIGEDGW